MPPISIDGLDGEIVNVTARAAQVRERALFFGPFKEPLMAAIAHPLCLHRNASKSSISRVMVLLKHRRSGNVCNGAL
jgi:hypothetical protein